MVSPPMIACYSIYGPDQGGDDAWLITQNCLLIDFTYDLGRTPSVDDDAGRFFGWSDETFVDGERAVKALATLTHSIGMLH